MLRAFFHISTASANRPCLARVAAFCFEPAFGRVFRCDVWERVEAENVLHLCFAERLAGVARQLHNAEGHEHFGRARAHQQALRSIHGQPREGR